MACVNTANLLSASLTDEDFERLTTSVAQLAKARLATCRVASLQEFRAVLAETRLRGNGPTVVCDWPLSQAEVRAAIRTGLLVIAPRTLRSKSTRFR
jgi:hypothetical protein